MRRRKDDFITNTTFKGGAGVWRDSGALSMMRGVWRGAAGAFLFINVLYKYFV
jgi:hypothetical protein